MAKPVSDPSDKPADSKTSNVPKGGKKVAPKGGKGGGKVGRPPKNPKA